MNWLLQTLVLSLALIVTQIVVAADNIHCLGQSHEQTCEVCFTQDHTVCCDIERHKLDQALYPEKPNEFISISLQSSYKNPYFSRAPPALSYLLIGSFLES